MEAELSRAPGFQSPRPGLTELEEWQPTHLRVAVLRARLLQAKGGASSSSPYVVIQLQKQKYMTSVVPHNLAPEWREECTLQLPSRLDEVEEHSLVLTAMHHSPCHFDQFLGRLCLPLAPLFRDKARRKEWFGLQSKRGRPDQVRGQLQLELQFMQILSLGSESALSTQGPQSLLTKLRSGIPGRRNKVYHESRPCSLCMSNGQDSSSAAMPVERDPSALMAGGLAGGPTPGPGTALCPATELQLRAFLSQEIGYEALPAAAQHPALSSSQSGPRAVPQSPKKSQPQKGNTESLASSPEMPQASCPPRRGSQQSGSRPQGAHALHPFRVHLPHPTSTQRLGAAVANSGHSCTQRCQLHLLGLFCLLEMLWPEAQALTRVLQLPSRELYKFIVWSRSRWHGW